MATIPAPTPTSTPSPVPSAIQLPVPTTGSTLTAYPLRLSLDALQSCIVYVDDTSDDITQMLRAGSYVLPPDFGLLTALVPPGGRVLDLGAHMGTFTLAAAAWGYQVLAVEASPTNAALLRQSVAANRFDSRVCVVESAVGDHPGAVEFVAAGPYGFVANEKVHAATVKVSLTTVQQILDEVGWDRVDFIKLDVEGSEPAVLRGMADLLARPDAPPMIFEVNGYTLDFFGSSPQALLAQVEALGYRCYWTRWNRLASARATDIQPEVQADYLAVKQPLPPLRKWTVIPSSTPAELAQRFVAAASSSHPHLRWFAAQVMAQAPLDLLSRRAVIETLDRLAQDEEASVRAAAQWWHDGQPLNVREEALRRCVEDQADEIARLRAELAQAHVPRRKWLGRVEI